MWVYKFIVCKYTYSYWNEIKIFNFAKLQKTIISDNIYGDDCLKFYVFKILNMIFWYKYQSWYQD